MGNENIELVDRDYVRIPLGKPSKKIKFKSISHKNISFRWKNFRLKHLEKKAEAKKQALIDMEIPGDKLVMGPKRERVEDRVLRKTTAIAKLESKINFLTNGEYYSQDFIDSRAIKLKYLMMKNLVYNRDSLYSVSDTAAEQIMNDMTADRLVDIESDKISERVREILAEKEAAVQSSNDIESYEAESPTPDVENIIAEETNETPAVEKVTEDIPEYVVDETITTEMDDIDVIPVISSDEVAAAIGKEIDKINVEEKQDVQNVNPFINEDGSYRLRREDIDEDFRITRFDRSKLPTAETAEEAEPTIPPFNTEVREVPTVNMPRKAFTEFPETQKPIFPEIIMPTIVEAEERELPIVVPERNVNLDKKEIKTTENNKFSNDISALMARVSILNAERETINSKKQEAIKKVDETINTREDMRRQLSEYADLLEKECNESYSEINDAEQTAAANEAEIEAMMAVMTNMGLLSTSEKKTSGRVR